MLPVLATAEQIAKPLGITSRTITAWAAANKIPVALRQGKILRFYPPAVAAALGLDMSGFGGGTPMPKPASDPCFPNPSHLPTPSPHEHRDSAAPAKYLANPISKISPGGLVTCAFQTRSPEFTK